MSIKLNFGFLYRKKKPLRKNSFKLNSIFWNKHLREVFTTLQLTLNLDLGCKWRFRVYGYFKSSFKSSQVTSFPKREVSLGWPGLSSADAWIVRVPGPRFHFSMPWCIAEVWGFLCRAEPPHLASSSPQRKKSLQLQVDSYCSSIREINTSFLPNWFPFLSSAGSGSLVNILFRNK